jgi:hypothetical protein
MVNDAGVSGVRHPSLLEDDFADFQRVLGINLLGIMLGVLGASPLGPYLTVLIFPIIVFNNCLNRRCGHERLE